MSRGYDDAHHVDAVSGRSAASLACTNSSSATGGPGYSNFKPIMSQIYTRPREMGIQANYEF